MDREQPSFTDVEYGNRRRVSRREQFLETMDATLPWARWVGLIEPHYYSDRPGKTGRKAKPIATMLRMYLLQVWFNLSDEGVEDAIYDSYAMRKFMRLDFALEQVPDAGPPAAGGVVGAGNGSTPARSSCQRIRDGPHAGCSRRRLST